MEDFKQYTEEEQKQYYKEVCEKIKHSEEFIDAVQEVLDKYVSRKCLIELSRWQQLNKDMQGLRDEYASLIEEIREIKEETKKVYCGSGIRYKIARWLIK